MITCRHAYECPKTGTLVQGSRPAHAVRWVIFAAMSLPLFDAMLGEHETFHAWEAPRVGLFAYGGAGARVLRSLHA